MIKYTAKQFKHNRKAVRSILKVNDNFITCADDVRIHIPSRYFDIQLAHIAKYINTVGIFAVVDKNDNYAIFNTTAMISLSPTKIDKVLIDDVEYMEYGFEKDSVVIPNTNVLKDESVIYPIFKEFFMNGKVPYFADYETMGGIYDSSAKYAGSRVGNHKAVVELLARIIARLPNDARKFYGAEVSKNPSLKNINPMYVPLESVYYSYRSTTNKLIGSYFKKGLVSALVNPSEETAHIEKLLRA